MSSIIAEFFKDEIAAATKKAAEKAAKRAAKKAAKEAAEKAEAETKQNTLIESIRNAMQSWGLTAEAAMDGLKVPPDVQKQIRPLI